MKFIGQLVTTIFTLFISYLYKGFVLSLLWKWFIANTFNFIIISIPEAIGISLIMSLLASSTNIKYDTEPYLKSLFISFSKGLLLYSLILLIGWIVTFFIG